MDFDDWVFENWLILKNFCREEIVVIIWLWYLELMWCLVGSVRLWSFVYSEIYLINGNGI